MQVVEPRSSSYPLFCLPTDYPKMPREYVEADATVSSPETYTLVEVSREDTVYRIGNGRSYHIRHVAFAGTPAQSREEVEVCGEYFAVGADS